MPSQPDLTQRVLRAKLLEVTELLALLIATGQANTAELVLLEQRRIAKRLAQSQEGRQRDD